MFKGHLSSASKVRLAYSRRVIAWLNPNIAGQITNLIRIGHEASKDSFDYIIITRVTDDLGVFSTGMPILQLLTFVKLLLPMQIATYDLTTF